MATTPTKLSPFFFLFFTLFLQLHARESQFFSKFTKQNDPLPSQDPTFIPQTQDSTGYGLYGRLPPSTTTSSATTLPENDNTVAYTTAFNGKDSFDTTQDPQYDSKNQYESDSSMYMNTQKQEKFYGRLPPSTTTPAATNNGADDSLPTTLPENYNTVAYTTAFNGKDSFDTNQDPQYDSKNQYDSDSSMYMNNQKQDKFYRHLPPLTTTPTATNNGADDSLPTTLPENYNTVAYTTSFNGKDSFDTTQDPQYDSKNQYESDSSMYMNTQKQEKFYGRLPPSTTTPAATNNGADDSLPTTLPENYNTVAYTTAFNGKDSFDTNQDPQYDSKNQYDSDSSMYMNNQKQDKFYRHLPRLTTTPAATTLPENYNTVAYTTPIHSKDSYEIKEQYGGDSSTYDNQYTGGDGGDMYNNEKQGMSGVLDNGKYYHGSDTYNPEEQGMRNTRLMNKWEGYGTNDGNMYNTEKQGMSDTRYMENGKYYYDLDSQSSNPRVFGQSSNPRVFDSRNGYNTRGYNGNNDNRYNSNARFQENQEDGFIP